jgi:hypothetical protein
MRIAPFFFGSRELDIRMGWLELMDELMVEWEGGPMRFYWSLGVLGD